MSGRKRKADQLTRDSDHQSRVSDPATPPPAAMGGIMSIVASAFSSIKKWLTDPYNVPYTDITDDLGRINPDTHVKFSKPDSEVEQTNKRKKHKNRRGETSRSLPTHNETRNIGCGTLDIPEYNSEGEATKFVNDFWEPPEFGAAKRPTTNIPRPSQRPPQRFDDERRTSHQRPDGARRSRMTPERSSSPQSDESTPPPPPKNVVYPMPTTPESLPHDDSDISQNTPEQEELAEALSKLLGADGEETDASPLTPSGFVNKKRIHLAEERKVREKQAALKAARELRLRRRHPRKPLIRPLEYEWNDVVDQVIRSKDYQHTITTSIGGTELRLKDFATLLGPRQWLNDEIINSYIEWVVDAANKVANAQSKELGEPTSTVPKFIAHNSFFYENLIKKGSSSTQGLMRRKKAPGVSLLEVDSVFVPICKGSHWTVGVVRPIAKTIEYFDSMGGNPQTFIKLMRDWLKFQLGERYIESEWSTPQTACAVQSNGYDCGVFVCTNAFCVALGLDTMCYREFDMTQQRRNIAAVLINKGFFGDFAWFEGVL